MCVSEFLINSKRYVAIMANPGFGAKPPTASDRLDRAGRLTWESEVDSIPLEPYFNDRTGEWVDFDSWKEVLAAFINVRRFVDPELTTLYLSRDRSPYKEQAIRFYRWWRSVFSYLRSWILKPSLIKRPSGVVRFVDLALKRYSAYTRLLRNNPYFQYNFYSRFGGEVNALRAYKKYFVQVAKSWGDEASAGD